MAVETKKYRVIGTRPVRPDGVDKVTGRAVYGADVQLPRMLHGKVLRSPHAHARIKSIDTRKAAALPGVHAVITGADMPDCAASARLGELGETNMRHLSNNILAQDKVLYCGHAIAAVAASSPHVSAEAIRLIEVDYELLPPVMDAREAMGPDAPLLHDDIYTDTAGAKASQPSNLAAHLLFDIYGLHVGGAGPAGGQAAVAGRHKRELRILWIVRHFGASGRG